MTDYLALMQRLFAVNWFSGVKLGLTNVARLQKILQFPDRTFASIHVAGTNGKGSVTTKIAGALQSAGYRVGLYTSPHLCCFRERIRVNGEMISEEAVTELLTNLFDIVEQEKIPATFFELTTCLAFLYFAQQKVEVAVLETGLGGRLDATNIVTPCLSVITSISLDHTEILGTTEEAITLEKAGIIKPHVPVVIGPHVPWEIVASVAQQQQSPCIQVTSASPLFENENRQLAQVALEHLPSRFLISKQALEVGLEAKQPCRFEKIEGSPLIILDVAHNPDGLQHLCTALNYHYPNQSKRILFGLSKNKDLAGCLQILATAAENFHVVEATNGRGASAETLLKGLQTLLIPSNHLFSHTSIAEGVQVAKDKALQHNQILVVCGSFFIMSQVRQALGFQEACDPIDLNEHFLPLKPSK